MISSNALYYPHIAFTNPTWIKGMAMFYDRIYRIVPDGITPDDAEELQPLLENGVVGKAIDPAPYASRASEEFLQNVGRWSAAALAFNEDEEMDLTKIHVDKIDHKVRQLFDEIGYSQSESWISVPTEYASNYMLYLANSIGQKNRLELITNQWAPWTATSYFNLDGQVDGFFRPVGCDDDNGDDPFALFSLILSEIVPLNISEIPSEQIVAFRSRRGAEIGNLRNAIGGLYEELQDLGDPIVRQDRIQDKIVELKNAMLEYRKSADLIKAKGWFGVSFMGLTAPVTLATLFSIPTASTVVLAGTALALGAVFNVHSTRHELETLRKRSVGSCLVEMRSEFRQYTKSRGGGDMNFHAYNCMEEYVND